MRTAQEIFDIVVTGVLTQGRPSKDELGSCRYRYPDGARCAVGWLIPDDLYDPAFENSGVWASAIQAAAGISDETLELAKELQNAHDDDRKRLDFVATFKARAFEIARLYGLNANAIVRKEHLMDSLHQINS